MGVRVRVGVRVGEIPRHTKFHYVGNQIRVGARVRVRAFAGAPRCRHRPLKTKETSRRRVKGRVTVTDTVTDTVLFTVMLMDTATIRVRIRYKLRVRVRLAF